MTIPKGRPKRRGRKGELQIKLWNTLLPIVEEYNGCWDKLEYSGFLASETRAICDSVIWPKHNPKVE